MQSMQRHGLILAAVMLLSGAATGGDQPAKSKPLAVGDLYRLDAPRTSIFLPGAHKLIYVRNWIDAKTKQERNALWLTEASRERRRPLEKGETDAQVPLLSPDGKWLVVVSTRPRPAGWKQTPPVPACSDAAADLWLVSIADGRAIPLGGPQQPHGRVLHDRFYGHVAFSPDGKRLVFVADDGSDPRTPPEIANDVEIVRPDQGEGYTGYGPAQIWVAHLDPNPGRFAATRIDRVTNDDIWYGDPQWLPDGKRLLVVANKTADRESVRYSINKNFDLYLIDLATRTQQQLTTGPGPEVSPRVAPNGKSIVCLSVPRKGSHRDVCNLALVTLGRSGARTRVLFDHHAPRNEEFKPPHPPAAFPLPRTCWDGNDAFAYVAEAGTGADRIMLEVATGRPTMDFKQDDERLLKAASLRPRPNEFLKDRLLGTSKVITWKNEGLTIEAVLTVPPAEVARPPYKLLLYPHGGPHSRTVLGFDFTVQLFAGQGYAVLQPNFRGSSGYGQRFIDADRHDLGGGDMRDILAGIDQLVRDGVVDKQRQFVYGTSYGGFMTTWLVGHTTQFRAAVAQNAVTDMRMMWGLSDIPSWTEWEIGGRPWGVPDRYYEQSPLTHFAKVKTPTLILHARDDRRCPLPMGKAFYQALRARGVPTEMVIYPNEGHGIRQPRHREDVLRRVLAWFEKYGS